MHKWPFASHYAILGYFLANFILYNILKLVFLRWLLSNGWWLLLCQTLLRFSLSMSEHLTHFLYALWTKIGSRLFFFIWIVRGSHDVVWSLNVNYFIDRAWRVWVIRFCIGDDNALLLEPLFGFHQLCLLQLLRSGSCSDLLSDNEFAVLDWINDSEYTLRHLTIKKKESP